MNAIEIQHDLKLKATENHSSNPIWHSWWIRLLAVVGIVQAIAAFSLVFCPAYDEERMVEILDFYKATLWPISAVVLACVFRTPVRQLLQQLSSFHLKTPYGEFDASKFPTEKDDVEKRPASVTSAIDEANTGNLSQEELRNITQAYDTVLTWERIYSWIFGSQIALLYKLSAQATSALPINACMEAYQEYLDGRGNPGLSYDRYFHFLVNNGLIDLPSQLEVRITHRGYDFLNYLYNQKYPGEKLW